MSIQVNKVWFDGEKLMAKPIPESELYKPQEPVNWSVYNSGAQVASGLTFSEAWDYLTPERLARQWCAACVVDQSNMPAIPPAAQPAAPITESEIEKMWFQQSDFPTAGQRIVGFARAIEAKLKEKNT